MLDYLYMIPAWWLLSEFEGYWIHRAMHFWYMEAHEEHHMENYPPTDFYSKKYRAPSNNGTLKQNALFAIPALISVVAIVLLLGWWHAGVFTVVAGLDAGYNHYIHNAMHQDHWLGRFFLTKWWFSWIQGRHLIHHVELHKNLGMYNYTWDVFLGTKEADLRDDWGNDSPWAEREKVRQLSE